MSAAMSNCIRVHIVDNDYRRRARLAQYLFALGHHAEVYDGLGEFEAHPPRNGVVLAVDEAIAGGVAELARVLAEQSRWLGIVTVSDSPTIPKAVDAIRSGAFDFLPLPVDEQQLLEVLTAAASEASGIGQKRAERAAAARAVAKLSPRQLLILSMIAAGLTNREIATRLNLSPRTVDIHRAGLIAKLGVRNSAAAVRTFMYSGLPETNFDAEPDCSAIRAA